MTTTNLVYLENPYQFEISSTITNVQSQDDGKLDIQVDKTIFYPQSGGQPSDRGLIRGTDSEFQVEDTRFIERVVHHYGKMLNGALKSNQNVTLHLNKERRLLNMRIHTAGHVVASAMAEVRPELKPTKGYHFPDGPYVQFDGMIPPEERDSVISKLQSIANKWVSEGKEVEAKLVSFSELKRLCNFVPENVPTDKPTRIVTIVDSISIPDGGTHVKNLKEIGNLLITKIKAKSDSTIVSYKVE